MFIEDTQGEISDFSALYGFDLVPQSYYYTFASLRDAPKYSLLGGTYLGAPATKTFEGEPWEVMEANGLVYDFVQDELVPIALVTDIINLQFTTTAILTTGMILPGSLTDDGSRVKDYSAFYLFSKIKFKYSEVEYV